ncbi:hypothetical protein HY571_01835 [Candidatus Micrarchaeota archaeon]|nr:hypothetical protein [Candidatus Micrarchaeota archaeon]
MGIENEGENKEFGVATISDFTVHFANNSGLTSADDTAINKYVDVQINANKFNIRADQTVLLVSVNNRTFTSPVTIIVDKGHTETYNSPFVSKIVLRTTVENTNIKVRFF